MSELKAGDVVRLKSGGPDMTCGSPDEKGMVLCTWFRGGTVHNWSFRAGDLEVAGKEEPDELAR